MKLSHTDGNSLGDVVIVHRPKAKRLSAPATFLLFPATRRERLIHKIAVGMRQKKSSAAAEAYLASQLGRELRAMKRAQIPLIMQKRVMCTLESAVRGELWRLIFGAHAGSGHVTTHRTAHHTPQRRSASRRAKKK
jgi:hypothetical protein